MGKSPAFQFYPQDYLSSARVAEMTLEEEGVYIRLLCYCWTTGSIPADPQRCAKLAGKGCSIETATAVQRAFNVRSTDVERMVHDRLEKERESQKIRREQASKAGKKSAESRSKQAKNPAKTPRFNGRSTDVQQNINPSSSSSDEDESVSSKRKKRKCSSAADDAFDQFWNVYPRKIDKGHARKAWAAAIKKTTPESIIAKATLFADLSAGKEDQFIAYPSTWLNGERWEDEIKKKRDPFWYMDLPEAEREAYVRAEMAKP